MSLYVVILACFASGRGQIEVWSWVWTVNASTDRFWEKWSLFRTHCNWSSTFLSLNL